MFLKPGGKKASQSTQKWGTMMGCTKTMDRDVLPWGGGVREWILSSSKNSKMSLVEGLFSELFRGEPRSPARVDVYVCAHACVGESSSGNSTGKEDWGIHGMTLDLSSPAPQVQLLRRINCQLPVRTRGKGYCLKVHRGEETWWLNHVNGQTSNKQGALLSPFLGNFAAYKHWATQSFFRVKQPCPHLSASNWLPPFFICQGNYHSFIHLSPSKNLLKAFMANCLSFSLTLLINLFLKIPQLSL